MNIDEANKGNIKLCKDCKWCVPSTLFFGLVKRYDEFSKCTLAKRSTSKVNLVTGETKMKLEYAETFRIDYEFADFCGTKGKYWEAV